MKRVLATLIAFSALGAPAETLPDLGAAPELIGNHWLNSAFPVRLKGLAGKVVLVHFWTLGCINCKHNLPAYNAWREQFKDASFLIVGIHTPETDYERDIGHLRQAVQERAIRYPVLIDNAGTNWDRWHQQYWPAIYLVDKHGRIRDTWSGELEFDHAGGTAKLTKEIKELLAESR